MEKELLLEVAQGLIKTVKSATATDDMLALLCVYFAQSSPESATQLRESLQRMRQPNSSAESTPSFKALAERLEQALTPGGNFPIYSLQKVDAAPKTPEEARARLKLIRGGRSEA